MADKFSQIKNKWFKKAVNKKHKITKTLKKIMSKRRRQKQIDPCSFKNDRKCYYKGILDP